LRREVIVWHDGLVKKSDGKRRRYVTEEELALFCEEVIGKLHQLEEAFEELQETNESLQEEVAMQQQQLAVLREWRRAGRHSLPRVVRLAPDDLPVVILRWDS
jgi:chromosome segregation ATPase